MPACIHYSEGALPGDGVMFVFDAGVTSRTPDSFTLPPDELRSAKFVNPGDLVHYLSPTMLPRLRAAIKGADEDRTIYLER